MLRMLQTAGCPGVLVQRRPGLVHLRDLDYRRRRWARIALRVEDDQEPGDESGKHAAVEGHRRCGVPVCRGALGTEDEPCSHKHQYGCDDGGSEEPVAKRLHRVLELLLVEGDGEPHEGRQDSQRPYDEWHRDVVHVNRRKEDYRDDQSNYHPYEVLGRQGLEEVRPSAGLVANVVADVVGYHRWVPRVVLRDVLLDLPDEVRPHVCRLCEDSSAELSEQRGKRGAEPEASQDARVSESGVEQR